MNRDKTDLDAYEKYISDELRKHKDALTIWIEACEYKNNEIDILKARYLDLQEEISLLLKTIDQG